MKNGQFLGLFSCLVVFLQFWGQFKEWLALDLDGMTRMYFCHLGHLPKFFGQFKVWIILNFTDIVNFVFGFVPNCFLSMIFGSKQECFSLLNESGTVLFLVFFSFWTFSPIFRVVQGVICSKQDCLARFFFVFVLMLLFFYMSWRYLKSGNTVNTEYLNWILNLEYLPGVNVPVKTIAQLSTS